MLNRYSHLFLTASFSFPLLVLLWGGQGRFLFKKKRIIVSSVLGCTFYLVVFYFLALQLSCWYYSPRKILNLFFLDIPLDDIFLFASVSLLVSSATLVFASFEKKNQPIIRSFFKPFQEFFFRMIGKD